MHPTRSFTRSLIALVPLTLVGAPLTASTARADRAPTQPAAAQPRTAGPAAQRPATGARAIQPAPPPIVLAPIDMRVVPDACRALATQAQVANATTALPARISLASCMAERAVAPLQLCDCGASIEDIDRVTAPAIALLDDASAKAEPATKMLAEHAKGQLYSGLAIRMLGTVPKVAPTGTADEAKLRDVRTQTLEAQLAPWRESAYASFQRVVELARANPQLASQQAAASAVRDSQQRVASMVAVISAKEAENRATTGDAAKPAAQAPPATAEAPPTAPADPANDAYEKR